MDYYERFCDDLKLRGYAKRSCQSYLRAMRCIGFLTDRQARGASP